MVHALHAAHRLLKPNGILIDLRPMPVHRRLAVWRGKTVHPLGVMRELFDDDHAADRAVTHVLGEKLFRIEKRLRIECNRVMDTYDEFHDWLYQFVHLGKFPSHAWLVKRLQRELSQPGRARIVVSAPLKLQVLRKQDAG
jgi:hypothetical protein